MNLSQAQIESGWVFMIFVHLPDADPHRLLPAISDFFLQIMPIRGQKPAGSSHFARDFCYFSTESTNPRAKAG